LGDEIVAQLSKEYPTLEFAIHESYEDCNTCGGGMCTAMACPMKRVVRLYVRGTVNILTPRGFTRDWTDREMRARWLSSLDEEKREETWPFVDLDGDRPPLCSK